MAKVWRDGAHLWYQLKGRGDPVLTLIGGFALVDRQFEFCDPHLVGHHRILHWHYRGVGKSDWTMTEPCTVERWVDDLAAILDHAGIERTSVWCTSTGSSIGVRFAAKYPERTHSLIAYPWIRGDQTWRDIFQASYEVGRVFGIEQLSRLYAGVVLPPKLLYSKEGIEYEQWAKKRYAENVNMTTLREVLNAYANLDLSADIRNLRCPTLLLMGNDSALNRNQRMDSASYESLMREFRALKPDVEVATIRGAGSTYCMITKPKACCDQVIRFLKRLDRAKAGGGATPRKRRSPGRKAVGNGPAAE